MVFDCKKPHMIHNDCFFQQVKLAAEKRQELTCPICSKKVNIGRIIKVQLLEAEANTKAEDPWKIGDQENQSDLEVQVSDQKPWSELKQKTPI